MHEAGTIRSPSLKLRNNIGSARVVNVQEGYSRTLQREVLNHSGPNTGCASGNQHRGVAQAWIVGTALVRGHGRIRPVCYRERVIPGQKIRPRKGDLQLLSWTWKGQAQCPRMCKSLADSPDCSPNFSCALPHFGAERSRLPSTVASLEVFASELEEVCSSYLRSVWAEFPGATISESVTDEWASWDRRHCRGRAWLAVQHSWLHQTSSAA